MLDVIFSSIELTYLFNVALCLIAGFIIGSERELRGKAAGISTNGFIIGGAMTFAFISPIIDPDSASRIAANIVTGVGFLGAGIILKQDSGKISNLTTAASIWYSAALGTMIGLGFYLIVAVGVIFAILVPRIPHITGKNPVQIQSEE